MRDFLLPVTDAGAFVQVCLVLAIWIAAQIGVSRHADAAFRTLVFGIGLVTVALLGLRAMH